MLIAVAWDGLERSNFDSGTEIVGLFFAFWHK